MIALLLACSTSGPDASPAEALEGRIASMSKAVRRAARDDEATCEALQRVFETRPALQAGIDGGLVTWEAVRDDAIGLTSAGGHVVPDYRELALAVGAGSTSVALVTVGGVDTPDQACTDVAALDRWLMRGRTLVAAPPCARPLLTAELERAMAAQMDRCLCALPDPDPTPTLAVRLENAGLKDAGAAVRRWPETWKACAR